MSRSTRQAIEELETIQIAISRANRFSCLRGTSILATAIVGIVAGMLDQLVLHSLAMGSRSFVLYWFAIALINSAIVGIELGVRYMRTDSGLVRGQARTAVAQFVPCMVVGFFATLSLMQFSDKAVTLLPGLWCIIVSLGMFATLSNAPRPILYPAMFYGCVGCALWLFHDAMIESSSCMMGIAFGVGQFWIGSILWRHEQDE